VTATELVSPAFAERPSRSVDNREHFLMAYIDLGLDECSCT